MSYKRDGDRVTLEMSIDDYDHTVMALGMAAGHAAKEHGAGGKHFRHWIRIVNRVCEGSPNFKPYDIGPEVPEPEPKRTSWIKPATSS